MLAIDAALADAAWAERTALLAEKRQLAGLAQSLAADQDHDRLRARLEQLERQLEERWSDRLGAANVGAATGMGGGIDPEIYHAMNEASDKAGNVPELKAEIARLRRLLTEADEV